MVLDDSSVQRIQDLVDRAVQEISEFEENNRGSALVEFYESAYSRVLKKHIGCLCNKVNEVVTDHLQLNVCIHSTFLVHTISRLLERSHNIIKGDHINCRSN